MKRLAVLFCLGLSCATPPPPAPAPEERPRLAAWAALPADTFAPGPPSGAVLKTPELRGRGKPFATQPVQGISALLPEPGGYLALSDNGYGTQESSADFRLRLHHLRVDAGVITAHGFIELSDPQHFLPFPIVNEWTDAGRVLTGADLDPESLQPDGKDGFFIGDEFGPYVVHVDAQGRLLEPPIEAGERSPQNGTAEENATLKLMNALAAHAHAHGAQTPILSPWHLLIADGDPATGAPDRLDAGISSELVDLAQLHAAGFEVIPWTVNDANRARQLVGLGIDGLITDRPDVMLDAGINDLQGHRGARGLRPENTLPAFELARDLGIPTLELDVLLTQDGVPVVGHDPMLSPAKCRIPKPLAVRELTAAQVAKIVCDKKLPAQPGQTVPGGNYAIPTLEQVFAVSLASHFNVEVKHEPIALTDAITALVKRRGLETRVTLQSFDLRALKRAHETAPLIRTVALLADLPGENLEPAAAPLLAGAAWPYRQTRLQRPAHVKPSGGFEAMGRAPDGMLWPLYEKPLEGSKTMRGCQLDPVKRAFTGRCFEYVPDAHTTSVPDLQLTGPNEGIALERDDTQGDLKGFKRVFAFTLEPFSKRERVNLNDLPTSLALPRRLGDVGIGPRFSFPFVTPESVLLQNGKLVVMNDNNYPFSNGRHLGTHAPDDSELLFIELK